MKKVLIIFLLLMFFLVSSFGQGAYKSYNLNFTLQTTQYNKTYTSLASISEYPVFNDIIINYPASIYYLYDPPFYALAFYKNTSGTFDSGYYGVYKPNVFFKNGFPSGYLNKSLLYMEQFSLSSGSSISFVLLDLQLNQTAYNKMNYSNTSVFFNVIDRQSGITDYFNFVFLNGNKIQYIQQFLLPNSTDRYNYTVAVKPNISFNFDRFIIRQSVNVESGVIQDLGIGQIDFNNIDLSENTLPETNISFNQGLTGCLNKSETQKTFNVSVSSYDKENDTVLYSYLSYDYNYINKTIYYNKKNCIFFGLCINYVPDDLFSNIFYNGQNNSYCQVEKSDLLIFENPASYFSFRSQYLNDYGSDYELMLDLSSSTCSISNKQFIYYFDNPINNLYYQTEVFDLQNGDTFNITYYNPGFTRIKTFTFWFLDNIGVVIFDTYLNSSLNLTGFVNDYNTSSLWISIGNGQLTIKQNENIALINYSNYVNDSVKYIGLDIYPTTTIKQRGFTFAGLNRALSFSSQKPNNITFYQTGLFEVDYFITDDYHEGRGIYNKIPVYFTIDKCENIIPPINYEITDTLKTSFMGLCGALDGAGLNGFSFCLLFAFILSIVALLIAGVMALIFLSIAPGFALPVFMFVFSLVMILGSFIIELNFTFKMILGIMFAFSLALFLKGLFIGSNEV